MRYSLLEIWKTFERSHGSPDDVAKVQGMMAVRGRKRHIDPETGQVVEGTCAPFTLLPCFNTFILSFLSDVEFADDERESNPTTFKFMAMAHAWKMNQAKNDGGVGGGGAAGLLSGFTAAKASDADANSDVASSHGDESD